MVKFAQIVNIIINVIAYYNTHISIIDGVHIVQVMH